MVIHKKKRHCTFFQTNIQILWQPQHYDTMRDQTDKATTFSNTYLNPYEKQIVSSKTFWKLFYHSKVMREYVKRN